MLFAFAKKIFNLFFSLLFLFSSLSSFYITPYLVNKGYKAILLPQDQGVEYVKKEIKIKIKEYSPLIKINKSFFFLKDFPYIGLKGTVLSKEDALFLQQTLLVYEKEIEYKRKTMIKSKKKTSSIKTNAFDLRSAPPIRQLRRENQKNKIDKIILDAGHGGKDVGASSYGFLEKDLAILVTLDLKKSLLRLGSQAKIIMIRNGDQYVSLEKRCHLANHSLGPYENGLFVSIHLNTWFNEKITGFETYYLGHNNKILKARVYAHIEDTSFNIQKTNLSYLDPFKIIFSHLEVIQYQKESRFIANTVSTLVHQKINNYTVNRGVKSELFYVLKGVLMPSILIEVGFISNKNDLEFITDVKNRRHLTDSIASGIIEYEKDFEKTIGFSQNLFLLE